MYRLRSTADGEVSVGCFDEEVIHKAIGVAEPVVMDGNAMKDVEKKVAVIIIPGNRLLLISPASDVLNGTGILYSQRTSHRQNISRQTHL